MHGPAIVGVAFWAFLAIAAVGGMISDYKRRRLELAPLRAAIERGQPIDPALLERLTSRRDDEGKPIEPLYLRIGGIMTVAVGVGIALLSLFIRALLPQAFLPLIGAGLLVVCVGVGLLVAARTVAQHRRAPDSPSTAQDGSAA
ncbi:MAG TPA: DUF6249 domain-containing protein [Steroidobacteraceae bacterium]|nr:DUF6249 domain-containing protein [Steroidobacteraceae bacterium]